MPSASPRPDRVPPRPGRGEFDRVPASQRTYRDAVAGHDQASGPTLKNPTASRDAEGRLGPRPRRTHVPDNIPITDRNVEIGARTRANVAYRPMDPSTHEATAWQLQPVRNCTHCTPKKGSWHSVPTRTEPDT